MHLSWNVSQGKSGSRKGAARRTLRRRTTGIVAATALALSGALVAPLIARAADGPFTIDGIVPDPGTTQLADLYGNVKELGPINSNSTKIGVINSAAVPMLGLTNPNAQVDLRNAWLQTARDTSTNHDWLYFAWERDANSGSGFIAYEFMQDPPPAGCAYDTATDAQLTANCNPWANRKAGDFMILWDQQGGSRDLVLRTWSGTAPNLTLSAGTTLDSTVSQAAFSSDGFKGEAAVDLTATIFGGSTACKSFANTIPSTVTGNSDTADYKDTILKTAPPITNCTSTTVTTPKAGNGSAIPSGGLSIGTGVVSVKDSAVVNVLGGTAAPTGSVAFSLCKVDSPGLCTSGGTSVGSTSLTGTAYPVTVASPTAYVTSAGRYCWRAVWSGDSANGIPGSSDSSSSECFTVNPVTPTLATTAGGDVTLGQAVSDSAGLTGTVTQPADPVINLTGTAGPAAGGTITFTLYGPNNCTTTAYTSTAVTVSGNGTYTTPSPQFVPTSAGTYHWVASYSGSSPNTNGTTHNADCSDSNENVTVGPASTTTVTTPRSGSSAVSGPVAVGTSVFDRAVVTGTAAGGSPSGTVDFFVCGPTQLDADGLCGSGGTSAGSGKTLTAGANNTSTADSDSVVANTVGRWCFRAVYTSNTANYTGSSDSRASECFTVTDTTAATSAQNWLPNDSATITSTGGTNLNGTLSFTLYSGDNCGATSGSVLRTAETFTLTDAASPATRVTTNSTTKVLSSTTVSWLVTFTSSDPLVASSSHCEKTSLTITN